MKTAIDYKNRDPNHLNDAVKVYFDDVLGEPDGYHSFQCVWEASYDCFKCCKGCFYKLLTLLCGLPLALVWGCEFAVLTFGHVWCVTPCTRSYKICCGTCQTFYGTFVQCFVQPWFAAYSFMFSNIRITKISG